MLDARERRQGTQRALIGRYHLPVASFTLNIMGPVEVFSLAVETFYEGVDLIGAQLNAWEIPVLYARSIMTHTGCEYFWIMDGDLCFIRETLYLLEDSLSFRRLLDVDVINTDGREIFRTELRFPVRKCLLCSQGALVCGRARTHTVKELLSKKCQLTREYFTYRYAKKLSSPSMLALLYEVNVTSKPGPVDHSNTGAHRDMDIPIFEASAALLNHFFERFVLCNMKDNHESFSRIFPHFRSLGTQAGDAMIKTTHNINTYKGLIFSPAITNCPLGYIYTNQIPYFQDSLLSVNRRLVEDVLEDFKDTTAENAETNGEHLYALYGMKGTRREALSGYHTVLKVVLPVLKDYLGKGFSINDVGAMTLLRVIASSEDTNIVNRSLYGEMKEIQGNLGKMLQEEKTMQGQDAKAGLDVKAGPAYIEDLNRDPIQRNASSRGSADPLALMYFIYLFEKEFG